MNQARGGRGEWLLPWARERLQIPLREISKSCPSDLWLTEIAQGQLKDRYERLRAKHPRAAIGDLHSRLRSLSRVLLDRPPPTVSIELAGSYLEAHALGRREWVLAGIGKPQLLCLLPIGGLATAATSLVRATKAEGLYRRQSLGRTRKRGASDAKGRGRGSR